MRKPAVPSPAAPVPGVAEAIATLVQLAASEAVPPSAVRWMELSLGLRLDGVGPSTTAEAASLSV